HDPTSARARARYTEPHLSLAGAEPQAGTGHGLAPVPGAVPVQRGHEVLLRNVALQGLERNPTPLAARGAGLPRHEPLQGYAERPCHKDPVGLTRRRYGESVEHTTLVLKNARGVDCAERAVTGDVAG